MVRVTESRRPLARLITPFFLAAMAAMAASGTSARPEVVSVAPGGPTLRELIDVARRNKSAELRTAAARLAEARRPVDAPGIEPSRSTPAMLAPVANAPGPAPRPTPPKLWSLTAVGARWHAEILHRGRIRSISAADIDRRHVGPWRVAGLTEEGLMLERSATASSAAGATPSPSPSPSPRQLLLKPPSRGTTLGSFKFEAPSSQASTWPVPTSPALAPASHRPADITDSTDAAARAAALPLPGASTVDDGSGPADDE